MSKKLTALIINPPIRVHSPAVNFPLGLGYLAAVLRQSGCKVTVLELNALRLEKEKIIKFLERKKFDIITLGGMITIWNYAYWLLSEIRRTNPQAKLVLGGNLTTSIPELVMNRFKPDIMVIGEAESTITNLVQALQQGTPLSEVKGIWYFEGKEIKKTLPNELIKDINTVPYPAWDLFPMEAYINQPTHESGLRRRMDMISSRGCPFTCKFCYQMYGQTYRFRSPENILGEIDQLQKQYRIRNVSFLDDHLTANPARLQKFCDALIEQKRDLTWSCLGRVDSVAPDRLKMMRKAGCTYIGFGIESGSQKMLDAMDKKVKVDRAKDAIRMARKEGISVNATFIIGFPGETRETVMETVNFAREVKIPLALFFANPYPGTELFNMAVKMGKIKDAEELIQKLGDASDLTVNFTDMSDEELMQLRKEAMQMAKMSLPERFWIRYRTDGFRNFWFWTLKGLGFKPVPR